MNYLEGDKFKSSYCLRVMHATSSRLIGAMAPRWGHWGPTISVQNPTRSWWVSKWPDWSIKWRSNLVTQASEAGRISLVSASEHTWLATPACILQRRAEDWDQSRGPIAKASIESQAWTQRGSSLRMRPRPTDWTHLTLALWMLSTPMPVPFYQTNLLESSGIVVM